MYFDSFRFTSVTFKDIKTGEEFVTQFDRNDRFYKDFKSYVVKDEVEGQTSFHIDMVKIPKSQYNKIKNTTYKLLAKAIFVKDNVEEAWTVEIERVTINEGKYTTVDYNDGFFVLNNCNLVALYKTRIKKQHM
jgi:hypothetical protein